MNNLFNRIRSTIFLQNNTGKVARNTSILFLSEIFIKLLGIIWVLFLVRYFSVSDYGKYSLVTSFIAIFAFLPDFGVGLIVIREIAKDKSKAAIYLGNSFMLNGFLACVSVCVIILASIIGGINESLFPFIIIASLTLLVSTLRSVAIFYFDGIEKMKYSAILNSLNSFLLIIFALIGVILGFGLYGVFLGMLAATCVSTAISWLVLLKHIRPSFVTRFKLLRYYFIEGLPLGLAAFATLIYTKVDILILSKMLGDYSVGIYSAAVPFQFALVQLLNVPFVVAIYPTLTRLRQEDQKRFKKGAIKSILVVLSWSIPASIIISISSPFIILLLFGQRYNETVSLLQILIFTVPFISLSSLLYKILIIFNHQKDYLYISIISAIINVLLNIYMISQWGILGAAYASVCTQVLMCIFYVFMVHKRTNIFLK